MTGARRILFAFLSTLTAVVLLFGYRTSTPHPRAATVAVATGTATAGTPDPAGGSTSSSGGGSDTSATSGTYTGSVVQTRWGPVQVQITVAGGTITDVQAVQVPDGNNRDVQINARAVPRLNAEVLSAQSAQIDTVSGATVTSDGYVTSLQAAIDEAGL